MQKDQIGQRQRHKRLEVLEAIAKARMNRQWFEGDTPQMKDKDRGQATKDLLWMDFIEEGEGYSQSYPHPFCLTARGRTFLEDVMSKIGKDGHIDWQRVNEIEFPWPVIEDTLKASETLKASVMLNEKDLTERTVFSEFAQVSPLGIRLSSIEKRQPPEPDILCEIAGEGPVAFELTESVDSEFMRQMADWEVQSQLHNAFQHLPANVHFELENNLQDAIVRVAFHEQASKRERGNAIPQIFERLRQIDPSFVGVDRPQADLGRIVRYVAIVRGALRGGPHFERDISGWHGDVTLDAVKRKLGKVYNSSAPIELLVHYERSPVFSDQIWPELRAFLEQNLRNSRFRRVWVFAVKEKTIL